MASVTQALIIAAGNGSRLQPASGDLPKPLTPVCGVPLLKRLLHSAHRAGIESCVIVLGYQGERLRRDIDADPDIKVRIEWVMNEDWRRANGVSVLKAKSLLKDDFVLLMADHLFQARTLARFIRRRPAPGEVVLAVDRKIDRVYDIDDATKVQLNGTLILDIGKKLKSYNAIDTGMFMCSPVVFSALEASMKDGDCSLSDGMRWLIERNKLRFFDIKDSWWLDVDTPGALRQAERDLFKNLRRDSDGFFSRVLYRPFSLKLTKRLLDTSISGNHITLATMVLGLISAALIGVGNYWTVLLGALLFQGVSILDGSDGELARIKLQDTQRGRWLDTITDTVTYMALLVGIMIGYYNQKESSHILFLGILAILEAGFAINLIYGHLRRRGDWSHATLQQMFRRRQMDFMPPVIAISERFIATFRFAMSRDFFALLTLLLAVCGKLSWLFWSAFVLTHLTLLAVFYAQGRSWFESEATAASTGPEIVRPS